MATSISSSSTPIYNPATTTAQSSTFSFPTYTTFPPFYTLQPNTTTRTRQLDLWTSLILSYCTHHHFFRMSISNPPKDLFTSPTGTRSLKPADILTVLTHMSLPSSGSRIEFIPPAAKGGQSDSCYVWWRTQGEWADLLYGWIEETGQRGSVLTLYELRDGEGVSSREWQGMDEVMLRKVLGVLVKRGKAQMFGREDGEGVKFF